MFYLCPSGAPPCSVWWPTRTSWVFLSWTWCSSTRPGRCPGPGAGRSAADDGDSRALPNDATVILYFGIGAENNDSDTRADDQIAGRSYRPVLCCACSPDHRGRPTDPASRPTHADITIQWLWYLCPPSDTVLAREAQRRNSNRAATAATATAPSTRAPRRILL